MKLATGRLNQKIKVQRYVSVPDGAGGSIDSLVDYWVTSASVKPLSSSSQLLANQVALVDGFSIIVRYRSDKRVLPTDIILYRGRAMKIISMPVDEVYQQTVTFKAIWQET